MASNSLPYIAVSCTVAAAIAAGSYNQLSTYLQTQNEIHSLSSCPTWQFDSWGDPHIDTQIDNGPNISNYSSVDSPDFATIDNTENGATTVATTVALDPNWNEDVNSSVTISQAGKGSWSITAVQLANGKLSATFTDAQGAHTLQNGSSYVEPDGSTIMMANGQVTVLQSLSWGGMVQSTLIGNAQEFGGNWTGVSVYMQGKGETVINGVAAQQATGSNNAVLPCAVPKSSGQHNKHKTNGGSPLYGTSDGGGNGVPADQLSM